MKHFFLILFVFCFAAFPLAAEMSMADEDHHKNIVQMSLNAGAEDPPCIFCPLFLQFSVSFMVFSAAVYNFFQTAFLLFVPVLLAIWLVWKSLQLMAAGGANGRAFTQNIAKTVAITVFMWIAIMAPSQPANEGESVFSDTGLLWHYAGPGAVKFAFGLGDDVREHILATMSNIPGQQDTAVQAAEALGCADGELFVRRYSPHGASEIIISSGSMVVRQACMVEKSNVLTMGMSLAVLSSLFRTSGANVTLAYQIFAFLLGVGGVFVVAMATIWMFGLVLDVFVRGMVSAAIVPMMILFLIFPSVQQMGWRMFRSIVAFCFYAVALSLITSLNFFLILNTVEVYEQTREYLKAELFAEHNVSLSAVEGGHILTRFIVFIQRVGLPTSDVQNIPFRFDTPWTWYVILISLATYSLGKKMMAVVGNMLPDKGDQEIGSAIADGMRDQSVKAAAVVGTWAMKPVIGFIAAARAAPLPKNPFGKKSKSKSKDESSRPSSAKK